jgi:hypothetical protein
MNTPDPGYRPPRSPVDPPPGDERGSLLTGFLIGWVVLISSLVVVAVVFSVLGTMDSQGSGWIFGVFRLVGLLPFVSMVGLIVWFASKGKTRSAAGVGLTLASLIALVLLLVAACFGLFASGAFGNMH